MRTSPAKRHATRRVLVLATLAAAAVATPTAGAAPSELKVVASPATVSPSAPAAKETAVSTRGWRTLRGAGGFRVRAPKGYRLRVRKGAYEIIGARAELTLTGVRTGDNARKVAEGLLGVGLPDVADQNSVSFRVALKRKRTAYFYFQRVRKGVSVVAVAPRGSRTTVGKGERRRLATVARSARGIKLKKLPTRTTKVRDAEIPLKPFTNSDGSAKANVPDGDGWTAGGQQGVIEGGHPDLGGYAFGLAVPFLVPSAFCFQPCSLLRAPVLTSAAAVEQALPLFLASAGAQVSGTRVIRQVPGSAGTLGPGIDSGMYEFAMVVSGKPVRGYIIAGTFQVSAETWYLYYSYVVAVEGVSGSVGEALVRTWQSWDPSADQARRQRETFVTQQETVRIIQETTEYQRRVYDVTNHNWLQLIRGRDPVLDPVDPNVIGSGGETLVRDPDGRLFDLAGNQFKVAGG